MDAVTASSLKGLQIYTLELCSSESDDTPYLTPIHNLDVFRNLTRLRIICHSLTTLQNFDKQSSLLASTISNLHIDLFPESNSLLIHHTRPDGGE